jgi:hypothetical protein
MIKPLELVEGNIIGDGEPGDLDLFGGYESLAVDARN